MNKKAVSLSVNLIIIIVLALIVLVIAIVFFRTQVTKGAEKYTSIGEQLENCESFMYPNRNCKKESACLPNKRIRSVTGEWADCTENFPVCCED